MLHAFVQSSTKVCLSILCEVCCLWLTSTLRSKVINEIEILAPPIQLLKLAVSWLWCVQCEPHTWVLVSKYKIISRTGASVNAVLILFPDPPCAYQLVSPACNPIYQTLQSSMFKVQSSIFEDPVGIYTQTWFIEKFKLHNMTCSVLLPSLTSFLTGHVHGGSGDKTTLNCKFLTTNVSVAHTYILFEFIRVGLGVNLGFLGQRCICT